MIAAISKLTSEVITLRTKRTTLSVDDSKRVLDSLGGNAIVARKVGITRSAVSQWRQKGIPKLRLLQLRSVFGRNRVSDTLSK